jgi:hypothetical protein
MSVIPFPEKPGAKLRRGVGLAEQVQASGIYGGCIVGFEASGELVVIPTSAADMNALLGVLERAKAILVSHIDGCGHSPRPRPQA